MRKRGGMQLSINAIVILIIAMVVLGIGILFIRGLFGKSAERLTTAISAQDIQNPATPDRPLVADKEVLLPKSNPTKTATMSVYNVAQNAVEDVTVNMSDCVAGQSTVESNAGIPYYSLKTAPQDIPSNAYVGYQAVAVFDDEGDDNPGLQLSQGDTIVCKLEAQEGSSSEWTTNPSTTIVFPVTS